MTEPWKFYVHFEDNDIEYTTIVKSTPDKPVSSIISGFVTSVKRKYPQLNVEASQFRLCKEGNLPLKKTDCTIAESGILPRSDIFVSFKPGVSPLKESIETSSIIDERPKITDIDIERANKLKLQGNEKMKQKKYSQAIKCYTDAIDLDYSNSILFANRAQAYLNQKRYSDALSDSEEAIRLDPTFAKAYVRAGRSLMNLDKQKLARSYFVKGLKLVEGKTDDLSKTLTNEFKKLIAQCPEEVVEEEQPKTTELDPLKQQELIQDLQKSILNMKDYFEKGKFKLAAETAESVLKIVPGEKLCSHYLSTILTAAKKYQKVIDVLEPAVKVHPDEIEIRITLAEAYYQTKQYSQAIKILTEIKKVSDNDKERVNIRLARNLIASGQVDRGQQLIMAILQANQNSPDGLIEYANVLYDRGIYQEAIKVYLRALILQSENKDIRRKLALCAKKPNGVSLLKTELQEASSPSTFAFLALIFKDFGALDQSEELFKDAADGIPTSATYSLNYIHVLEIQVKYQAAFKSICKFLRENRKLSLPHSNGNGSSNCGDILNILEGISDVFGELTSRENFNGESKPFDSVYKSSDKKMPHQLSNDELDLLALFFTVVKVLYVTGNLKAASEIIKIVEQIRQGKELHLTTIRNEHAYYCAIAQLLPFISFPLPSYEPLYMIGDSHTLSASWQTVTINDKQRLTIPKLVTGCKMWHLREESYFFPKENFYNTIETIPEGSDVVFLFGEIDCREGILLAVEQCKYTNVEEGIEHTLDIYMKVLKDLKRTKKYRIFVHPVVPVLNETRNMVKQFNIALEKRCNSSDDVTWLNFFDSLLTDDGNGLRKEYELDGTHMNPSYLTLLEKAINSAN